MTLKRVPPPPEFPEQLYVQPKRSLTIPIIAGVVVLIIAAILLFAPHKEPPKAPSSMLSDEGPPAIVLRPSLIVPGPAQNPHPAEDGGVARPDEAIIFRVDIRGIGYVMVAIESPEGTLVPVYGGQPDESVMTGSQLLVDRETGKVLAVNLEGHKGRTLTFVTALSAGPWDPFPSGLPRTPRSFPDKNGESGAPAVAPVLAWDRFSLKVAKEIPVISATPFE